MSKDDLSSLPLAVPVERIVRTKCHLCGDHHREEEALIGYFKLIDDGQEKDGVWKVAAKNRKKGKVEALNSKSREVEEFVLATERELAGKMAKLGEALSGS